MEKFGKVDGRKKEGSGRFVASVLGRTGRTKRKGSVWPLLAVGETTWCGRVERMQDWEGWMTRGIFLI